MISLRAYNREIEQLIDSGNQDEALAHCRHILSVYPKCIETYCNIGKSLLESKKYSDAQDIFSRVLTAFPDDFIAHAGLSIIHENQEDLDLAIWHMEQAFDVQPSNLAIQDELKRLFSKRDGEKPIKVRLTRGALVRMYARGELYQQAISEIYSVLESDSRRIDLEVILAKMFFLSGSKEEAIHVCDQILSRFPFCFEPNQILQQYQLDQKNNEAAEVFRSRLIDLDPYYEFRSSPFDDSEIADDNIQLERLAYQPETVDEAPIPAWIEDQKTQWSDPQNERIEWLKDIDENKELTESTEDILPIENEGRVSDHHPEEDAGPKPHLPEWMVKAGWITSPGNNQENLMDDLSASQQMDVMSGAQPLESSDLSSSDGELVSEPTDSTNTETDNNNIPAETNDDLASLFSELQKEPSSEEENGIDSIPELSEQQPEGYEASSEGQPAQGDMPDWLKSIGNDDAPSSNTDNDVPDWLKELQGMVEPIDSEEHPSEQMNAPKPVEIDLPDDSIQQSYPDQEAENPIESVVSDSWEKIDLTIQEDDKPKQYEHSDTGEISSDDAIPDWVKSVLLEKSKEGNQPLTETQEPVNASSGSTAPLSESESTSDKSGGGEGIITQQTNDDLLDWLRGLKTDEKDEQPVTNENEVEPSVEPDATVNAPEITSAIDEHETLDAAKSSTLFAEEIVNEEAEITNIQESLVQESELQESENKAESPDEGETAQINEIQSDADTLSELVKEPVTTQVPPLPDEEQISVENFVSTSSPLAEILQQKSFDELPKAVEEFVLQGQDIQTLINQIKEISQENQSNFNYWQSLGDIYAHHNLLDDAIESYLQAEEILRKSLSS